MASGIFAVLDDIAALMDDVAVATKVAAGKTAGILGDDLAVNAEKATGFLSSREIPVLWAITKGSLINKAIIVPIALLLNFYSPLAIKVILVIGGFYLAFEGVEKIIEYLFHRKEVQKVTESAVELDSQLAEEQDSQLAEEEGSKLAEKTKIRSAIITDFILSVEIVFIALANVQHFEFTVQILTVCAIAFLATIGVYGIVALIVRMDDAGYKLIQKSNDQGFLSALGHLLVRSLPVVIKILSIVGTVALLLVSGGIFDHNIDALHHALPNVPSMLKTLLYGLVAGILMVSIWSLGKKLFSKTP